MFAPGGFANKSQSWQGGEGEPRGGTRAGTEQKGKGWEEDGLLWDTGRGPAAPWSLLLGSRQAVPLAGGLWGSSGGDVEAQTEAASPPKLSLGQGRGLGMLQGVGIPPQAGSRTKGDGEGQGTTARAIWPWQPAACGDNLLPSRAAHGAGLPPCSCCCHPRDPSPSPPSPKTSTLGARWGTASPRALMFLGAPLADHPGWRQRRGEDVSAGPV